MEGVIRIPLSRVSMMGEGIGYFKDNTDNIVSRVYGVCFKDNIVSRVYGVCFKDTIVSCVYGGVEWFIDNGGVYGGYRVF